MNNNNAEELNRMGHKFIDELQTMGHDFINTAMSVSVPFINTMTNVANTESRTSSRTTSGVETNNYKSNNIKFYRKNFSDKILICCEIPGVSKENCKINYSNRILKICGTSCFTEDWGFIKSREYNLQLDIGERTNNDIKVKYENGLLKIHIKNLEEVNSNIEID